MLFIHVFPVNQFHDSGVASSWATYAVEMLMMFQEKWQKVHFLKVHKAQSVQSWRNTLIHIFITFFLIARGLISFMCFKAWASYCSCWLHEYKRLSRTGEHTSSHPLLFPRINCIFHAYTTFHMHISVFITEGPQSPFVSFIAYPFVFQHVQINS